ncbi:MAG TPA: beta-propeller fold lactonase family protein [Candidatus Angelobacter sp.]|nr:beta-propeller fold lactonase family protein [Candidatus Angelobacter sp.]
MKALIRIMALLTVTAVAGCGGGSSTIKLEGLPDALLYVVGAGSNNIQGFQITTLGQLAALSVSSFSTNPIPVSMALTPSRLFMYVANSTSNTVSGFNVNHTTGDLTPVGTAILPTPVCPIPATCNFNPMGVTVDSAGKFVFVLNQGSANPLVAPSISVFGIDPVRGLLTEIGGSPFAAPANPEFILASPALESLYVSTGSGTIAAFSIGSDGTLSPIAGSPVAAGANIRGMVIDPKSQFLYATDFGNNQVASFSIQSSGALSPVAGSPFPAGMQPVMAAIDSTGTFLYVANQGSNNVSAYKVNAGVPAQVSGSPYATAGSGVITPTQPTFLVVDPTNAFLFVADQGSRDVAGFSIKSTDGTLTMVTNSPFGQAVAPTWMLTTR